jgi:peroxiredoxin
MRIKSRNGLWLLAAALLAAHVEAAEEAPPAEIGLRIGERAPNFTLQDQNSREVSLESLLKKGPVAVVFIRSADWCRFCKFELIHLQRNLKQFKAAGAQVVSISYDSTSALKKFADSREITLPLLSDVGSKTIDAYGVRDNTPSAKPGFAAHATFVLDQKGIVRAKLLEVIYQEQPGVGFLLNALKAARNPESAASKKGAEKHPASSNDRETTNPET